MAIASWTAREEPLPDVRGLRFTFHVESHPATVADVVRGWRDDAEFRAYFNALLANVPYSAFRWETPAATRATLERPFEFVLLDSPDLAGRPDPAAFAQHFTDDADVVSFANLGGDAILVVPCPKAEPTCYGHVAAFVRRAPERQRDAFWRLVGDVMERRLGTKPVWLSTAGAGVSWLHVRLDDRPKYYGFAPYRRHA
jgi:hypothetical protein